MSDFYALLISTDQYFVRKQSDYNNSILSISNVLFLLAAAMWWQAQIRMSKITIVIKYDEEILNNSSREKRMIQAAHKQQKS